MRTHSKQVKQRFVKAIEAVAKEKYPKQKEVDVIKSLGLSPANYYRLRSTRNNYPTIDQCVILCEKYKVSAQWLLLGAGYMKQINEKKTRPVDMIKQAVRMIEGEMR